jgi:hypothetical protein
LRTLGESKEERMQTKLIAMIAGLLVALAVLGAGVASAAVSSGGCPEARYSCQPVGDRPSGQAPRGRLISPKATPRRAGADDQTWQAGSHLMN